MIVDFDKVCENILGDLPSRKREVLEKRFGLKSETPLTLQAIGNDLGITRERVRQIGNDTFLWIKENKASKLEEPFQYFLDYFNQHGGLRGEESLINDLGGDKYQGHILLFLTIGDNFLKFKETDDFYPLWTIEAENLTQAKRIITDLIRELKKINRPIQEKEIDEKTPSAIRLPALLSYIDISKFIFQSPFGEYGLIDWPEIMPRGLKDKAYLALKKAGQPLHFREIAEAIAQLSSSPVKVLPESVHNELIRNNRFVLVGRGVYALKEWGYEAGTVKDIIKKVLRKSQKPLSKEEIIKQVLSQRKVKESTIVLNLQDKKVFEKNKKGKYSLKKS